MTQVDDGPGTQQENVLGFFSSKNKLSPIEQKSLDEFINPVDKQIAVLFQKTSSATNNENGSSHRRHSNLHNISSSNSNSEEDDQFEDDEDSSENEVGDEKIVNEENKSFGHQNSKKMMDNFSIDAATRSSIRKKTKEGIRKVFDKFNKAVTQVQSKAEEVFIHSFIKYIKVE